MEYEIEYLAGDWVCEVGDDDYSAPRQIMCVNLDGDYISFGDTTWVNVDDIQGIPLSDEILEQGGFQPYQLSDMLQKLTGAEHGWVLERGEATIRIAGDHLDIRVSNGTVLPTRVVITAHYVHELQHACRLVHINLW